MKISVSRLNSIGFCPKAHHYTYTLNLEPKKSADALELGSLVHEMLEEFYRTGTMPILDNDQGEIGEKAKAATQTYALMAKMQDRFEVVDVEREFSTPLEVDGETIEFTGIIDAVVRLQGELWLLEHKTCSQHWSNEQIGLAPQHVLYEMVAEELYGEPVKGTFYNFLRLTTRGGQAHADVKRVTVPADEHIRASVWEDMEQKVRMIKAGLNYRNPGKHCSYCNALKLCQTDYVGGDTAYVIDEYYTARRPASSTEVV